MEPTPLTSQQVEELATIFQDHVDRTATLNGQTSIRIARLQADARELDQVLIPHLVMQGQYGVMDPELGETFKEKLAELAENMNDLGETISLLATQYNNVWTETRNFLQKLNEAKKLSAQKRESRL